MCYYQQASYSITISSYNSGIVVAKTTVIRTYLNGDPITIPLAFKPYVTGDFEYNVILVASSFGTDLQAVTSFSMFANILSTIYNSEFVFLLHTYEDISPTLMPKENNGGGRYKPPYVLLARLLSF